MFDILQALTTGQRVTAHGKEWLTLYRVGGKPTDDHKGMRVLYLAAEASAQIPAPVVLIEVYEPTTL